MSSEHGSINIALVGCGFTLHTQLPAFRRVEGAQVTDLVGRDLVRTRRLAAEHRIARASIDLREVLERDDVDLVCVTTPPDLHREMAEAALAAGKHVLCEKPMALDVGEAESMCRVAARSRGLALIDHQLRFAPAFQKLRRLLADGFLGQPMHVDVVLRGDNRLDPARPFDWWSEAKRGGGALGALGSHMIDLLRWLFGEVSAASGLQRTFVTQRQRPGEVRPRLVDADDHAMFSLRLGPSGRVMASVTASVVAHRGGGLRFEVFGSNGMLRIDDDGCVRGCRRARASGSALDEPPLEELSAPEDLSAQDRRSIPDSLFARAFLTQARQLIASLRRGETQLPHAAGFRDGMAVQAVLEALQRSSRERCWVDLPRTRVE